MRYVTYVNSTYFFSIITDSISYNKDTDYEERYRHRICIQMHQHGVIINLFSSIRLSYSKLIMLPTKNWIV